MNFPKAETVVDVMALADQFRAAGTLRRQANAVRVQVANALTEGEAES